MIPNFPVRDAQAGWWLAPDFPPPPAASYPQEILALTVLDEVTGLPPELPPAATGTAGLVARAAANGAAGLAGIPLSRWNVGFIQNAPLQFSLSSLGYIARSVSTTLPAQSGYPQNFIPATPGPVLLHRAPTAITGRVTDASQAPLAAASVTVDGIWPTIADLPNPTAPPNLIALATPLYADRSTSATVAVQNLTAGAAVKMLLRPGNVGDSTLRLSDQIGLAPGSIMRVDQEFVIVSAIIDAGATPQQPATAQLSFPLALPHAAGAAATPMLPLPAGPTNGLARASQAGDVTIFPAAMAGLNSSMTAVVITGGGAGAEYHAASRYAASTDAAGRFGLPPLHRLAQLSLRAHHPSQATDLLVTAMLPFGIPALALALDFT
jgi:hypothetical protein